MPMDAVGNIKRSYVKVFVILVILIVANDTFPLSSHSDFEKDTKSIF